MLVVIRHNNSTELLCFVLSLYPDISSVCTSTEQKWIFTFKMIACDGPCGCVGSYISLSKRSGKSSRPDVAWWIQAASLALKRDRKHRDLEFQARRREHSQDTREARICRVVWRWRSLLFFLVWFFLNRQRILL